MKRKLTLAATLVAAAGAYAQSTGPSTAPATRPAATRPDVVATSGPSTQAVVSPAAAGVLTRLSAAYTRPGPLHVMGTLVGTFDVAGRHTTYRTPVDGRTDGVGNFLHDAGPNGLMANDGTDAYLYDRKRDAFAPLNAVFGRQAAADVSGVVVGVLLDENPAVLLSIVDAPAALLRRIARSIDRVAPTATQPATQPARPAADGLVLDLGPKRVTLWLDESGQIVASAIDYRPLMRDRGATRVKAADVLLTYDRTTHEVPLPDAFTWRPPESATEFDAGEELIHGK